MKQLITGVAVAVALLGATPLVASCDVSYRLWQDGDSKYYTYGDTIFMEVGDKAHLYIHGPKSRSSDPYSVSADIGAPTVFGTGGQRQKDINRVLRTTGSDSRKGKIELEAINQGETALAYRITAVVRPGRLEQIPAKCRIGQVRVTVRGKSSGGDSKPRDPSPQVPGPSSAGEAAHLLITDLYKGILRRPASEAEDYPNDWHERVQREGLRGLVFIAESMAVSPEFRQTAIERTRQALQSRGKGLSQDALEAQLLSDIFQSLYGSQPESGVRNLLAGKLSTCLNRGNMAICKQFGRDLLSQRHYQSRQRDLLANWRY